MLGGLATNAGAAVAGGLPRVRVGQGWLRPDEKRSLLFVLPFLVIEIALVAVPLGIGFYYSFFRVDYFELTAFRGLGNYGRVLTSPMVLSSLAATAIFSTFALVFTMTVGMGAGAASRARHAAGASPCAPWRSCRT